MPKPFLVFLYFLVASASTYAQKDNEPKRDSSIIIFSESPRPGKSSRKYNPDDKNVIKIAPLGFIKGCIPVYYERRITDFLTIQAGAGITTRNYIRGLMYDALNNDNVDQNDFKYTWNTSNPSDVYGDESTLYNFDYRTAKPGYFVSLQPRIYFESEAPEGSFLAVSFDHYHYKFQSQMLKGDGTSERGTKTMDEYEKMNDIMVLFGWQTLYDRITLEYTSGIGVRNIKGEKYAMAMDGYGKPVEGTATYKKTTLNVELGIRVGFHF